MLYRFELSFLQKLYVFLNLRPKASEFDAFVEVLSDIIWMFQK